MRSGMQYLADHHKRKALAPNLSVAHVPTRIVAVVLCLVLTWYDYPYAGFAVYLSYKIVKYSYIILEKFRNQPAVPNLPTPESAAHEAPRARGRGKKQRKAA